MPVETPENAKSTHRRTEDKIHGAPVKGSKDGGDTTGGLDDPFNNTNQVLPFGANGRKTRKNKKNKTSRRKQNKRRLHKTRK